MTGPSGSIATDRCVAAMTRAMARCAADHMNAVAQRVRDGGGSVTVELVRDDALQAAAQMTALGSALAAIRPRSQSLDGTCHAVRDLASAAGDVVSGTDTIVLETQIRRGLEGWYDAANALRSALQVPLGVAARPLDAIREMIRAAVSVASQDISAASRYAGSDSTIGGAIIHDHAIQVVAIVEALDKAVDEVSAIAGSADTLRPVATSLEALKSAGDTLAWASGPLIMGAVTARGVSEWQSALADFDMAMDGLSGTALG